MYTSNRDRKIKYNPWPGHGQNDLSYSNVAGKFKNYFIQQRNFINYLSLTYNISCHVRDINN